MDQEELDEAIAQSIAEEDKREAEKSRLESSGENLSTFNDLDDPNPDLHDLFMQFNAQFFDGVLASVEVKWSLRMTYCAGVCSYQNRVGYCSIRLSEPLLKYRPRSDMIDTLLHEMIHAYLFITRNNRDHNAHGPEFCKLMERINRQADTHITVYHSFHDEVDNYRKHIWQCNGSCRMAPPYYGLVKRSMNRPPQPHDPWFSTHEKSCGGQFVKISEPLKKSTKEERKSDQKKSVVIAKPISSYFEQKDTSASLFATPSNVGTSNDIKGVKIDDDSSASRGIQESILISSDDDEFGRCNIAFKFPNGERIVNSFSLASTTEAVYCFVRRKVGHERLQIYYTNVATNSLWSALPLSQKLTNIGLKTENYTFLVRYL